MTDAAIRIIGFAGCTSLGYSLEPTLAAMGAGLSNFTDTGIVNLFATPVAAGSLLESDMSRAERLVALTDIALVDVAALLADAGVERAPFMVSIASDLADDEAAALKRGFEKSPLVHPSPAWVPYGRAGALLALQHAADLVGRGAHRFIVVGGIDTLCAPATVQALVESERVLGPHTEGTIPGEGAVFALVSRADDEVDLPTSVLVAGSAQARGTGFMQLDRVSGDALTSVFRMLREQGAQRVDWIVAAHSGEGYFGRSFSHAYLREVEIMPEPLDVDHTADRAGDVGAAAGMLGVAFAMYRMATRPAKAQSRALVYSESDTGEIGAVIIQGSPKSWLRLRRAA
jgi:3-oxoacyl-[acyl-carrier-protein] synthase-1